MIIDHNSDIKRDQNSDKNVVEQKSQRIHNIFTDQPQGKYVKYINFLFEFCMVHVSRKWPLHIFLHNY